MKEKSLESRRVRTHPTRRILSIGTVLCSAWLIGVIESWLMLKERNLNAQCSTLNVQYSTGARLLYHDGRAEHGAYAIALDILCGIRRPTTTLRSCALPLQRDDWGFVPRLSRSPRLGISLRRIPSLEFVPD